MTQRRPVLTPLLQGDKVALRGLSREDINGPWMGWFNDAAVTRFMWHGAWPNSVEELTAFYEHAVSSKSDLVLAIVERATGRHVGNVSIQGINWLDRKAEVGIVLGDRSVWGKGYGTEALRLVTRHAFERLNLHKLFCAMHADNVGSRRAFERAGFRVEARLRGEMFRSRTYYDAYRLGITSEDYDRRGLTKVVAIVEAQVALTESRGTVVAPVLGRPVLDLLLERLRRAGRIDEIVVATSDQPDDDEIEAAARRSDTACLRSGELQAVRRMVDAADRTDADAIVVIRGESPLVDPDMIDGCVDELIRGGYDLVANHLTRTYPSGLEVQVTRRGLLEAACAATSDASDRDSVTSYALNRPELYRLRNVEAPPELNFPAVRLGLNTDEDLAVVRTVYEGLYYATPHFSAAAAVNFVRAHPDVRSVDETVRRIGRAPRPSEDDQTAPRRA